MNMASAQHRNTVPTTPSLFISDKVSISTQCTVHEQICRRTMCCIYDLVYSLETHIKHLHVEALKGYKMQHTLPAMSGWRAAAAN